MPDPKQEAICELGMGLINVPFAIPNIRIENPEADRAHAHRLVPFGLQHPARVRGAVLRRRAGRRAGRDPKDYLLELIGPPRIVTPQI